jgi:hypothetical protein
MVDGFILVLTVVIIAFAFTVGMMIYATNETTPDKSKLGLATSITNQTINGEYCVFFTYIDIKKSTDYGSRIPISEEIQYIDDSLCYDSTTFKARNLHEYIKERQLEIKQLQEDPIAYQLWLKKVTKP